MKVVLIYQGYVRERDSRLWRGGDITSPWLQTNKVSKALEKLNFYYKLGHHPDEDGFFVAQVGHRLDGDVILLPV